jgi:hypothetical protein
MGMAIRFAQHANFGGFTLQISYTKLKSDEPWEWTVIDEYHNQVGAGFANTLNAAEIAAAKAAGAHPGTLDWQNIGPTIEPER